MSSPSGDLRSPCIQPIQRVERANAVAEGLSNKFQQIKRMVYGFRNIEDFETAVYFPWGRLELYRHEGRKNLIHLDH